MGQTLKSAFRSIANINEHNAALIASEYCGVEIDPNGGIDHQSLITIPYINEYGRKSVCIDYFNDIKKVILDPKVIIIGGNDNEKHYHPISGLCDSIAYHIMTDHDPVIGKYNKSGNFWALFDPKNGTKIRVSFGNGTAAKSDTPELVDLKITDWCGYGCQYCYQGSTKRGKHAKMSDITSIMYDLSSAKVFEVALGGGEPTKHPEFAYIIETINNLGIVANLSTRNFDWISNVAPFVGDLGAIGFSIDKSTGLEEKLDQIKNTKLKLTLQVVIGSCSQKELEKIIQIAHEHYIQVLFLGWKYNGRGNAGPKHSIDIEALLDKYFENGWSGPNISMDTVLVNQMYNWLTKHSHEKLFTTVEGAHSMYIDAVNMKMGRSSFCDDYVDCSRNRNTLEEYFSTL